MILRTRGMIKNAFLFKFHCHKALCNDDDDFFCNLMAFINFSHLNRLQVQNKNNAKS